MADIAVLDRVVLALGADEALLAQRRLRAVFVDILERIHIGLDEAFFEVRMDDARSLGGLGADRDGPGPDLDLAAGEVRAEPEGLVGGHDDLLETARLHAQVLHEHLAVLAGQLGDLAL